MSNYNTVCQAIKTALDAVYASKTHSHTELATKGDIQDIVDAVTSIINGTGST